MKNSKQDLQNISPSEWARERQGDWGEHFARMEKEEKEKIARATGVPAHWIGVDYAPKSDITAISMPCGNCGTYRMITGVMVQRCPNCGDDEIDLSESTIYDQEGIDEKNHTSDQNSKIPPIPPHVLSGPSEKGDK